MDKPIVIVALEQEVTPNIHEYADVIFSGCGKVNALLAFIEALKRKPKTIYNFGTAGGLNKNLKGLIRCFNFIQYDMDAVGLNFVPCQTPFDPTPPVITLPELASNPFVCGSADKFLTEPLDLPYKIDFVEMEAYALAKACLKHNLQFKCYKYISDSADEGAAEDWQENTNAGCLEFIEVLKGSIST